MSDHAELVKQKVQTIPIYERVYGNQSLCLFREVREDGRIRVWSERFNAHYTIDPDAIEIYVDRLIIKPIFSV